MRRLLWIGDAVVATGFARCTHHMLEELRKTWDVHVIGINYLGDPHPWPYAIYPCWPGGDGFGVGRTRELAKKLNPDLVVIQNDPWNVAEYRAGVPPRVPVVASMPVDGRNCKSGRALNGLALGIFWTRFGLEEARAGGYLGSAEVLPLGVDLARYHARDRYESRRTAGVPDPLMGAFIVGNVNRNQPRKRLDLTVEYFADFARRVGVDKVALYLHVAPTGETGYDVAQLMHYHGIWGRLILGQPEIGRGIDEEFMPTVYSCFDVQLTTSQGEGWGLTTMEGMACGVPQIVPQWAALAEWTGDAARQIPCTSFAATPVQTINAIGGIPDRELTVEALRALYESEAVRNGYVRRGLELVARPEYRWPTIARRFAALLDGVAAVATAEEGVA